MTASTSSTTRRRQGRRTPRPWTQLEKAWARVQDPNIHFGLSYGEFREMRGKYGTVHATPIRRHKAGEVIGVLSVDLTSPQREEKLLDTSQSRKIVCDAALAVAQIKGFPA